MWWGELGFVVFAPALAYVLQHARFVPWLSRSFANPFLPGMKIASCNPHTNNPMTICVWSLNSHLDSDWEYGMMNMNSIKAHWVMQSELIEREYSDAAAKYADCCAAHQVTGVPVEVFHTEFECAVEKRNRMLGATATELLKQADASVKNALVYEQYADGLITSVECCNALSLL